MVGEGGDGRGELHGDARADDDHRHARQHGAVERGQVGHLDLLEEIDPHGIRVAFARKEDLDEIRRDAQFLRRDVALGGMHAAGLVGLGSIASAGDEIGVQDVAGDAGEGKLLQRAADMAFRVAILQAARQDFIQGGSGDDAQLAQPGYGAGQPPVRNAGAHAALNDLRN